MKVYVVYCHPDADSFTAAIRRRTIEAFEASGQEVRISDLYAEDFEPAMTMQEEANHLAPKHQPEIVGYCDSLRWCDTLVFIYPTWWSAQPAMMTGWLDRVFVRGVAWDLPEGATRITARLTNVRRLVIITSHGSSKLINLAEGETGRRVIGRAVRVLCHRFARTTWLAMYNLDRSSQSEREAFLDRVEQRIRRLSSPPQEISAGRKW
ncbi:MAG: NAD(P)H-dependent oxidoreductase [Ilumatobacteraceae bacterium]